MRPFNLRRLMVGLAMAFGVLLPVSAGTAEPRHQQAQTAGVEKAAEKDDFARFLDGVRREALQKGISARTVAVALPDTLRPLTRVIEADRSQPEKKLTFAEYITRILSARRVDTGHAKLAQHAPLLAAVESKYGVNREAVVALWGIETNYGRTTGGFSVVQALATLAHDPRRASYFRGELFKALKILDQGHVRAEDFKGSWAGAMGQVQFMPSSFFAYAVDHDGDGRRDIWTNDADALASAANYLKSVGWKKGQLWGEKIDLPKNFNRAALGLKNRQSVQHWRAQGVKLSGKGSATASIIQPDGAGTQAYAVYDNFRVIMRWNNAQTFAAGVGSLSDTLKAGRPALNP